MEATRLATASDTLERALHVVSFRCPALGDPAEGGEDVYKPDGAIEAHEVGRSRAVGDVEDLQVMLASGK